MVWAEVSEMSACAANPDYLFFFLLKGQSCGTGSTLTWSANLKALDS